jgi:hypothetical protein
MSVLLFVVGALALMVGVAMIGFGVPINEFSFGNTLIIAGMSAAVGGLIVIGLGAVVSQLHRIAEGQGARLPVRPPGRAPGSFEVPAGAAPAAARVPFPPKPRLEPGSRAEPRTAEPMVTELPPEDTPPFLRNPNLPPLPADEPVSLSPGEPLAPSRPDVVESERIEPVLRADEGAVENFGHEDEDERQESVREPVVESPRRSSTYFDRMWPAPEPTSEKPAPDKAAADMDADLTPSEMASRGDDEDAEAQGTPEKEQEPPAVLKSGVVDGMGYTLYVDGSIEAELPQGTLRFASINDLRSYLEKNA